MPYESRYRKYRECGKRSSLKYYYKNRENILNKMRERYRTDDEYRKRCNDYQKKWQEKNREKARVAANKYYEKLREGWGRSDKKIAKKAEILSVKNILPSLGFKNILYLPELRCRMFYDILAEKEGIKYGIQVKTTVQSQLKRGQGQVAQFFGLPFLVLFVKPSLDYFKLMQYQLGKRCLFITKKDCLIVEGNVKSL